jgi:hypothetical protein
MVIVHWFIGSLVHLYLARRRKIVHPHLSCPIRREVSRLYKTFRFFPFSFNLRYSVFKLFTGFAIAAFML